MVKEGIVLGHKISKSGIEVDRAKVDVIAKLPHPTTVKDLVPSVPITRDRGTQLFCNDQLQRAKIVPLGRTTLDDALWGFPYYSIQNTSGVLRTRLYMERHMSLPIEGVIALVTYRTGLGCAETKVATWDDLAFKLIILGWKDVETLEYCRKRDSS
ncbi:hypothetical protein Tco_0737661 [Tanacetum coccineum]